jgi:hypothetical protein
MKVKRGNKVITQIAESAQKKLNGEPHGTEAVGSLSIIEADKMAASLDDEALANKVRDGVMALRTRAEKLRPFVVELHVRFESLKTQKAPKTIRNCANWQQFCDEVLGYSPRHMRRLMEGSNPAAKYRNKTQPSEKPNGLATPAVPSVRDADWADDDYIKTCVDFVMSTLRPLESDPQRFLRVAHAIAQEIAEDGHDDSNGSKWE